MKEISIADVEHDLRRLYQIKADVLLESFLNVIEIIRKFPPNEYFLSHLGKHKAQAMVYVKTSDEKAESSTNAIRIADVYKSFGTDTSTLETLPWNPIDDTICTTIHSAGVMPCAFPHWIKKGSKAKSATAQSNDRVRLVEKAQQKDKEKEEKELTVIRRTKALKKKRSKERKQSEKKLLAKRTKLNFEGESLDPNEIFDEQGNIHIGDLVNPNNKNEENDKSIEDNSLSDSMNFETYCRDAAAMSDDSIDS